MTKSRPIPLPRSPLLALSLALAVSACASLDGPSPSAPPRHPAATGDSAPAVPPPPPRPLAKAPELKALRPSPRPVQDREAATPSALAPKLVGLSEDETIGLLGQPAEETAQPPGKVWIYKASGCQLSVHLFPDMDRGGFYALDYSSDSGRDACLGKVAGEARRRGGALGDSASRPG